MGFRRKIKQKIKQWLQRDQSDSKVVVEKKEPINTAVTESIKEERKTEQESVSSPSEHNKPEISPVADDKKPNSKEVKETKDTSVEDDKIAKHLERTKKGILKFIVKKGGTSSLADMHDHSEKRFFIGHRKFSDLMETMIEEELLDYSWEKQEATITKTGKERLA